MAGGDIRIGWDSDLMAGDFSFLDNDLESDDGLKTSVVVSLFSDRRAHDDDLLPDPLSSDKRGWWGDLASPDVEEDQIGSRLWLLGREKTMVEVLRRAEEYAREALEWLLEDDIAAAIDVTAERINPNDTTKLGLDVKIRKIDGTTEAMEFTIQWENMYAEDISIEYTEAALIPAGVILDEVGDPLLDEDGAFILDI
jgi:phage gp46-like protein